MLTKKDKERIIELREQGHSYKSINKETGFALQTISNVLKEHEERKLGEMEQKNRESKGVKECQIKEGVVSFDSTIEGVRELSVTIDNIIKKGQLKADDRREWERRNEELQNLLKVEVDERIAAERADAVATRDEEWREFLKQNYVEKKVATDLDNTNKSKDVTIKSLQNTVTEKATLLTNKQYEISQLIDSHQLEIEDLKSQIRNLSLEKQGLIEGNWNMHNIIQNYSNNYERREQEYLKRERELSNEKITFNKERKEQEIKSDKSFFEADKKYKEIEKREKQLDEQTVKLKKRENEFNKEKKQFFDTLNERIKTVENREKNVIMLEKRLLKQKEELDREGKKINYNLDKRVEEIKNDQEKITKEWEKIFHHINDVDVVAIPKHIHDSSCVFPIEKHRETLKPHVEQIYKTIRKNRAS